MVFLKCSKPKKLFGIICTVEARFHIKPDSTTFSLADLNAVLTHFR
jgi:hypothetical protein